MKRQCARIPAVLVILLILISCENDSPDDLVILNNDPQTNVTYTKDVAAIINSNCIVCHGATPSNGAPMSLTTYEQVKDAVQNRGLINRISREQGTPGMMPNGGTRLPQNAIERIIQWNQQGLLQ